MSLTAAIERLRYALKMHDEHRTTLQSLASSVGDFLRDYANIAAKPAAPDFREEVGADGKPNGWLNFGAKPAGAVPLPDQIGTARIGMADGPDLIEPTCLIRDAIAYGDDREAAAPHALREKLRSCEEALAAAEAREAAGRAVAPDYSALKHAAHKWANLSACAAAKRGRGWARHKAAIASREKAKAQFLAILAAPTPQQPAAEGDDVAEYLRSEGLLDEGDSDCISAIRAVVDDRIRLAKWVAELHLAQGAGREAVAWITDRPHAANDGVTRCKALAEAWKGEGWQVIELSPAYTHPTPAADAGGVTDAIESILGRLDGWSKAYPTDIFPEPSAEDRKWLHETRPGLMDRIAASMGRHMHKMIGKDLATITAALTPEVSHGE